MAGPRRVGGADRVDPQLLGQLVQLLAVDRALGRHLLHVPDFIWSRARAAARRRGPDLAEYQVHVGRQRPPPRPRWWCPCLLVLRLALAHLEFLIAGCAWKTRPLWATLRTAARYVWLQILRLLTISPFWPPRMLTITLVSGTSGASSTLARSPPLIGVDPHRRFGIDLAVQGEDDVGEVVVGAAQVDRAGERLVEQRGQRPDVAVDRALRAPFAETAAGAYCTRVQIVLKWPCSMNSERGKRRTRSLTFASPGLGA